MSTAEQSVQQVEQSKEQFMTSCMADGSDKETCEARWKASHQINTEVTQQPSSPGDIASLLRKNELLEARLQLRENQLKQAIDIAARFNEEKEAKEHAARKMLIDSIKMDSSFTEKFLSKKSTPEIQAMRLTLDKTMSKTFASVAADIALEKRRNTPHLTAGAWDSKLQRWVGGI